MMSEPDLIAEVNRLSAAMEAAAAAVVVAEQAVSAEKAARQAETDQLKATQDEKQRNSRIMIGVMAVALVISALFAGLFIKNNHDKTEELKASALVVETNRQQQIVDSCVRGNVDSRARLRAMGEAVASGDEAVQQILDLFKGSATTPAAQARLDEFLAKSTGYLNEAKAQAAAAEPQDRDCSPETLGTPLAHAVQEG